MENNTEQLRLWFRECPVINAKNRFGVDYLSEKPTEYAIYSSPSTLRSHENVLGESILDDEQELNFIFASKETYGADIKQNLANLAFYEAVCDWIVLQNNKRNFPKINEGKVKGILPTLTAYAAEVGSSSAKYQIQLKLTYRRF